VTQREPTPELMRLFPPLTRWSPEVWAALYERAELDPSLPDDRRAELRHLCEVWELAAYGFRHRHAGRWSWHYAIVLIRQARALQDAFYNGQEVVYAIQRGRETYLRLQAEIEAITEQARLARARASRARGTDREKRRFLDQAEKMRAKNPALTDQDITRRLQVEFGQRSERTYRRWLASGRPKR